MWLLLYLIYLASSKRLSTHSKKTGRTCATGVFVASYFLDVKIIKIGKFAARLTNDIALRVICHSRLIIVVIA